MFVSHSPKTDQKDRVGILPGDSDTSLCPGERERREKERVCVCVCARTYLNFRLTDCQGEAQKQPQMWTC